MTAPEDLVTLFNLDAPSCCGRCARTIERFVALAEDGAADTGTGAAAMVAGAARALLGRPARVAVAGVR